jgi:hypothetical protein
MTFLDDIETEGEIYFDPIEGFAESITYEEEIIFAVEDTGGQGNTGSPGALTDSVTLYVKKADVPKPHQGDEVIFRSENYSVVGDPQLDGGIWTIQIMREVKTRVSV